MVSTQPVEPTHRREVGATPIIGIGGIPMRCRFGDVWDEDVTMLHSSYTDAVAAGGGVGMIIPPSPLVVSSADALVMMFDGLILAGGGDIDPALYGQTRAPETGRIDPVRDASELALTKAALTADVPILGICRGMELLNIARGGTLIQDLPARLGHDRHLRTVGTFEEHSVVLCGESIAARLVGATSCSVRSHHHQAVEVLGDGVVATGWAADEDVVESIELAGSSLAVGVQWHPEEDPTSPVIPTFVRHVARRKEPR